MTGGCDLEHTYFTLSSEKVLSSGMFTCICFYLVSMEGEVKMYQMQGGHTKLLPQLSSLPLFHVLSSSVAKCNLNEEQCCIEILMKCLILHYIVCFCRQPSFSAAAKPYRPEDAVGRPCCGCGCQIGYSQPYYQLPLIPVNSFFRSPQILWKEFLPQMHNHSKH